MSATSRSCPNMLLSYNIQQKWLMRILWEDSVFSHMFCTCLTEYTSAMKTPKLKHIELPGKLFLEKVKKRMLTFTVLSDHMLVSKMYWQMGCLCLHAALWICKCSS
jgi:hypothetical protein